ncbi:7598_t:CDS:2 [Funneliformis caledonium]|uniref:7598_t:CDS:1 n=1 Tax=Funneliformis caledonium TaxID=1117310 RepID=A0A9N9GUD1_9GLOM|nr:7598_t:CDS:2 [Funneliformis caledonium]
MEDHDIAYMKLHLKDLNPLNFSLMEQNAPSRTRFRIIFLSKYQGLKYRKYHSVDGIDDECDECKGD